MDPAEIITYLIQEEEEDEEELNTATVAYSRSNRRMNNSAHPVRFVDNRRTIHRNRALGNELIFRDYFCDNPIYPDNIFRRRFRMRRTLFS